MPDPQIPCACGATQQTVEGWAAQDLLTDDTDETYTRHRLPPETCEPGRWEDDR